MQLTHRYQQEGFANGEWCWCIITFENDLAYLYGAYEKLWDEKYHASGLINLVDPFSHFGEEQEGCQTHFIREGWGLLRV
jgi:hypothetical protein